MAYGIGLDIGIASVGYAVVALDKDEKPCGIIRLGSRIFDAAEQRYTGDSLAAPRREARSARRRLRRCRHRKERIKNLIVDSGLVTAQGLEELYTGQLSDIYELRARALDYRVSDGELARILIHLAQRRGFKSNRKAELAENGLDKENGKLLEAVSKNLALQNEKGYRTVGEMFAYDEKFAECKRNKAGDYKATVQRAETEKEAHLIIQKQRELGNSVLTEQFENKYIDILTSQRNFDDGPGEGLESCPSPYAGNQIKRMVGNCTFEKNEPRAAKACYSFEYFNLLQKLNHLVLVRDGKDCFLNDEQMKKLIALAHKKAALKYKDIRKELQLEPTDTFKSIDTDKEAKESFEYLKFYHQIRKKLESPVDVIPKEDFDEIGTVLTYYKSDNKRCELLSKIKSLSETDIENLIALSGAAKFGHLSLKALRKIIPFLETGHTYSDACAMAGYEFKGHDRDKKTECLPAKGDEMEDITSPVARRSISQTIKVINAIIREQNESPTYVKVELAREMARNSSDRKKAEKDMKENRDKNGKIKERIAKEFGKENPTGLDIIKLKLYEEQDGRSPYSQKAIELASLFEPGYVDVDHIIPYSICFDDSFNNKVLVFSSENRDKGNVVPRVYLRDKYGKKAEEDFVVYVESNVRNYRKKQKLLKAENPTEEELSGFKERNLTDTKTVSKFMYNYINDHLLFAPSVTGKKKRVTAVNGAITAYMRKRWGIAKVRADGDKHHAVDALVIACTTDGMIQRITRYNQYKETFGSVYAIRDDLLLENNDEEKIKFPEPWENFRKELEARLTDNPSEALASLDLPFYKDKDLSRISPIFVSRMPRHKVTGAAHKETIRSPKLMGYGYTVTKTDLASLKLKDGEIEGYYNPDSDRLLYSALKDRLAQFGGDVKKAFAEPFRKPKSDGTPGPIVKKVKIMKKATLAVPVLNGTGVADNDIRVRVDVFKKSDGYYLVPIYVADTLKKELPNKAIASGKPYSEWPVMDDEDFVFSLYPNDLFRFTRKSKVKLARVSKDSTLPESYETEKEFVYYKETDISTGTVTVINNDNTYKVKSLGVKTLKSMEKYQVDVLGNIYKVNKEKRMKFN